MVPFFGQSKLTILNGESGNPGVSGTLKSVSAVFGSCPRFQIDASQKKARFDFSERAFLTAVTYADLGGTYAAICFVSGTVVLISILLGKATAATGAVISRTPFTYSALNFSVFTPSGSSMVLSNFPYANSS